MISNVIEKYEKHFLRNDFIVLIILYTMGLCFLYFKKISVFSFVKNIDNFYSDILTISSGLFVFLITSVTILISFLNNENLKLLRDTEHPKNMLKTFFSGIKTSGVVVVFSLMTEFTISFKRALFYIILFLFLIMIIRVVRIVWILYNLSYLLIIADNNK